MYLVEKKRKEVKIDKEENIAKVSKSNQDLHWKQKYLKSTTCKNIGPDVQTFLWPHKGAP